MVVSGMVQINRQANRTEFNFRNDALGFGGFDFATANVFLEKSFNLGG